MRKTVNFRSIKDEIRVLGIDDAPFKFKGKGKTILVGTVFRAGDWLDGVLSRKIKIDGLDATEMIIDMVSKSRHRDQLRVMLLDGVTFGGMNVADIREIYKRTQVPIIVVNRKLPDIASMENALKNFKDGNRRLNIIKRCGTFKEIAIGNYKLYVQLKGIKKRDAERILKLSCTRSHIPEALRAAHIIASGIVKGESRGGA